MEHVGYGGQATRDSKDTSDWTVLHHAARCGLKEAGHQGDVIPGLGQLPSSAIDPPLGFYCQAGKR